MISLGRIALVALGFLGYRHRHKIAEWLGRSAESVGSQQPRRSDLGSNSSRRPDVLADQVPADRSTATATGNAFESGSEFANEGEVSESDALLLEGATGRVDDRGAARDFTGSDEIELPPFATPKSVVTGRHDEGQDANETIDGLTDTDEMTRRLAEDTATRDLPEADVPVFDRGRTRTTI